VPGRRTLLGLLDARHGNIGHRSGLEQSVAGWLDAAGLTGWRANHRVPVRGGTLECDFVWIDDAVVLEVSPFVTHGSRATQERDAERRRLLVAAGWRVVEATDADLAGPQSFARCLDALRALVRRG
jgi:very-short-patch-repair endonuclease